MEKLQIAIEHARKLRESQGDGAPAEPRAAAPLPDNAAWETLTPFEPKPRHLARHRILTDRDEAGVRSSLDMLRTRLLSMMRTNGWKRVMLTSPTSGCGKSTLAANLALSFQRQEDLKTLLIDLDLQQATLGDKFGLAPKKGVTDFLTGEASIEEQFYRIGNNLALCVGRSPSPQVPDLLKSTMAQSQIDLAEKTLEPDVVLIDMPPMFASDDTIVVAGLVDCAIIFGAAGQTSVSDLKEVEHDLAQYTNIAGVVLNKCRAMPNRAGYGYGYR